ncbi:type II toxin-antitoxin system VapC family toxin [Halomonas salipaludis]|uniref:Ribonuclease VapC n=1 Tax=Halomonas salipaludis TaxID=2032625 RepID=A0A2A2EUV9_9GAMM|nr:type II toxin-antitoxin system VapC family toxin [Halomonas salipaludis]PAU76073.1 VapC toxin family PIN domain ribonuclease [Halomonas salipaludis]
MTTYMLDTCICSFIMREHPASVIQRLTTEVEKGNRIVVSAITYAEMRYGQLGKKASAKHKILVDEFVRRLDAVLAWDQSAVDATVEVMGDLTSVGRPIGPNDTAIAGHAIASGCTLVTNNVREFGRVKALVYEDWCHYS